MSADDAGTNQRAPGERRGRIVEQNQRELVSGSEVTMTLALVDESGAETLVKGILRKIDTPTSYVSVAISWSAEKGTEVVIFSGNKGNVQESVRHDLVEIVTVSSDGSIRRTPEYAVPVRLDRISESSTLEDILERQLTNSVCGMP